MEILNLLNEIPSIVKVVGVTVTSVVTGASAITAYSKTPRRKSLWGKIYRIIELFALVTETAKEIAEDIEDEVKNRKELRRGV